MSRIRAPLEEEGEEEEGARPEERSAGSDDSSSEGSRRPAPPLSRAKTSSCGEMCEQLFSLSVDLISSQALGDVGRAPAMSRPDSPRGLLRSGEDEEEEFAKAVVVFLAGRLGLSTAAAERPLLSLPCGRARARCVTVVACMAR